MDYNPHPCKASTKSTSTGYTMILQLIKLHIVVLGHSMLIPAGVVIGVSQLFSVFINCSQ